MAHFGTLTRVNCKLGRNARPWKLHQDDYDFRWGLGLPQLCLHQTSSFSTSLTKRKKSKNPQPGLIPFDPNDAPESKDLRTPFVPKTANQNSLWKQTKDGVKNQVSTPEERRQVTHPSLFYRQDHEDKSWLFRSSQLAGHDTYKAYRPRSNYLVISLSIMALIVHMMTREENDWDVIIQKQGWYRLLWLNAPYDSSKDPRSNKEVGKTMIGVPLISPNTLLNNSKDE